MVSANFLEQHGNGRLSGGTMKKLTPVKGLHTVRKVLFGMRGQEGMRWVEQKRESATVQNLGREMFVKRV